MPSFLGRLGLHPLEIEAGELIDKAIDNYFVCLSHPGMSSMNLDSCSYENDSVSVPPEESAVAVSIALRVSPCGIEARV